MEIQFLTAIVLIPATPAPLLFPMTCYIQLVDLLILCILSSPCLYSFRVSYCLVPRLPCCILLAFQCVVDIPLFRTSDFPVWRLTSLTVILADLHNVLLVKCYLWMLVPGIPWTSRAIAISSVVTRRTPIVHVVAFLHVYNTAARSTTTVKDPPPMSIQPGESGPLVKLADYRSGRGSHLPFWVRYFCAGVCTFLASHTVTHFPS